MDQRNEAPVVDTEEFDPLQYIASGFIEKDGKDAEPKKGDFELEIPSIHEFINGDVAPTKRARRQPKTTGTNSRLSAPRPRRVKEPRAMDRNPVIAPELQELWRSLPTNIEALSALYDDKVTSNYYTGEFKETRGELIRRLLDPELTLEEVSRLLGVCPATVRRYTNREWLHHHRTQGGQRRFRLSNVLKFLEVHGRNSV